MGRQGVDVDLGDRGGLGLGCDGFDQLGLGLGHLDGLGLGFDRLDRLDGFGRPRIERLGCDFRRGGFRDGLVGHDVPRRRRPLRLTRQECEARADVERLVQSRFVRLSVEPVVGGDAIGRCVEPESSSARRGDTREVDLRPGLRVESGRLERDCVGERYPEHVVAKVWRARQAPAFGHVPAVAAGVLAAVHAEVERRVEGVELLGGDLPLLVAPGRGHRLVERRIIAHHPVANALRQRLELTELAGLARRDRLERIAGPAALAE